MLGLTIGNFDGVHRGHRALLEYLKHHSQQWGVVTFINHPSTVLKEDPTPTILSYEHKERILKEMGIEVHGIPFTRELSYLSAKDFLVKSRKTLPFDLLVLGPNARLGHKREAGQREIAELAQELGFRVDFVPLVEDISSTGIRCLIQRGELKKASALLGRSYSIFSRVQKGVGLGKLLGFKTMNIHVEHLVLPPLGVYTISAYIEGKKYKGVANLGHAPTIKNTSQPGLEVHLLDYQGDMYEKMVEVVFDDYLREERKFASVNALKRQIEIDISLIKN